MKLILIPGFLLFQSANESKTSAAALMSSANINFDGNSFIYAEFEKTVHERRRFEYKGNIYHYEFLEGGGYDYPSLEDGRWVVIDGCGKKLAMNPVLLRLLIANSTYTDKIRRENESKVVGNIRKYPVEGKRETVFAISDKCTGDYAILSTPWFRNEYLLVDRIILFDVDGERLLCLDFELNVLWVFKPKCFLPKYFRGPEIYKDITIQSFGPDRISKSPAEMRGDEPIADKIHHHDTTLYGVDIKNGHELWRLKLPKTVDNMEVVGDRLYISSINEIHVIEPSCGEALQVVETGLSDDYDIASHHGSSLHIEGDYLYFCHSADACILIYRISDLELERRVDIPVPYTIKGFEYCHKPSGRLYFHLSAHPGQGIYYHMSPLLEVDPSDLHSDIEIYDGPPVEIELKPSAQNPEEQEVWVTLRDIPLDEAMVFAEMHTQNQAYYHGKQSRAFATLHQTNNFNGKVHLRYSSSDRPASEVRRSMDVLEERFAEWARNNAFSCTDPSQAATLEAIYV